MRARSILLTFAAGLVLADASIVTLALPDLLRELDTTVQGVAAVIAVPVAVIALALLPVERLQRRLGSVRVGTIGLTVFALASLLCALSGSLGLLLAARALQALGGAGALLAAFALLVPHGEDAQGGRRLWLVAAVLSAAVGPALGGALTEAFSWQSIFVLQAIGAGAAALVCATWPVAGVAPAVPAEPSRVDLRAGAALALVSAALTAVLFLLVLLLVAGWNVSPLAAAATVSVIPAAALAGSRIGGDPRTRAAAGCALTGAGTLALAFLPDANLLWTVVPEALAGLGMGLALPALGGELLPERNTRDAAVLLTLRHAGIAVALVALAPVVAAQLDDATQRARERGVALVLDAKLPPQQKIKLAPALLAGVEDQEPRAGLRDAVASERDSFSGADRVVYDHLGDRADETLVTAVGEAFDEAFLITGALALLGAFLVVPRRPRPVALAVFATVALAAPVAYAAFHASVAPAAVVIQDPCKDRALPSTGGITGFLQDRALELLDSRACKLGSSREELVLALADPADARQFESKYGTDPRSTGGLLDLLLGG
jgi:MFS family permease